MLKEVDVQEWLWKHFTKKGAKFMFINIFYLYDILKNDRGNSTIEMDYMLIDESDYVNEYEIKTTKSDFKEEFATKGKKHELLSQRHVGGPNRYWFACPAGIIDKETVPEYAGLVEFKKDLNGEMKLRIVKKAPLLHSNIVDPRTLFYKVYYKYYNFIDANFGNTKKRIRRADGTKAVEKKRVSKKPKRRRFTVARKQTPTDGQEV